ncbi:MAG: hypothetical protein U5K79_10250 [Cyclobacteriaceae bacterium]|nr:hypothetical protein [Cyclobacteriaceae bacterium]
MKKREFLKSSALIASGIAFLPSCVTQYNSSPAKAEEPPISVWDRKAWKI